ncbi:hypothetical protein [Aquabacterium sp. NJ1]|uniref:hypothetical protein n=1 Tax=Aquabacterium sp. NJ1 TaxID=1538295 RepID=UPI00126A5EA8|nr:hypothetical protein [Aquabacterium sp. NJ1]
MSTAVVMAPASASGLASWFKPGRWIAGLHGQLRTALQPRVLYVQPGSLAADAPWDAVAESLAAWCTDHVGERCVIGLSSQCLLHALVSDDLSEHDAIAQAVQQWAHYMDVDAAELEANWLLRRVTVAGQHLVCAVPLGLIEALQTVARAHGVRLAWVGPWWAHGVQSWLSHPGLAAGMPPDANGATVTLVAQEPGLLVHVQASVMPRRPARLQRVWVEMNEGALTPPADVSVELVSPAQLGITCQPHHAHVWDQPQLVPVLQGDAAVWGRQP